MKITYTEPFLKLRSYIPLTRTLRPLKETPSIESLVAIDFSVLICEKLTEIIRWLVVEHVIDFPVNRGLYFSELTIG